MAHAPTCTAQLSEDFSAGRVWLRSDQGDFPLRGPLDQLWTVHRLGVTSGLLVHAAAVAFGDVCDLLVGQSGAGKSTLAALLERDGGRALSDERIVLRRQGGVWIAHGTPWCGTEQMRSTRSARVRRVLFLSHGPAVELRQMTRPQAMAALFHCLVFARWLKPLAENTLAAAESLVTELPCFSFSFPPDQRAVKAIAA